MKLIPRLLFIYAIKNLCSASSEKSGKVSDREVKVIHKNSVKKIDESKDVNKLIGKILHADRFNELADKIADIAVQKMNELQKSNSTPEVGNQVVYRSPRGESDEKKSEVKSKGGRNHIHGNIDVDAVLKKKGLHLDDLKLRYKHLKHENSHKRASFTENNEETKGLIQHKKMRESNEQQSSLSVENKDYVKMVRELKTDFDKNVTTKSEEEFHNPHGEEKSIAGLKKEKLYPTKADVKFRSGDSKETKEDTAHISEKHQTRPNKSKEKQETFTQKVRREGNKNLVWEESPDYKEYHDQLAKLEEMFKK